MVSVIGATVAPVASVEPDVEEQAASARAEAAAIRPERIMGHLQQGTEEIQCLVVVAQGVR